MIGGLLKQHLLGQGINLQKSNGTLLKIPLLFVIIFLRCVFKLKFLPKRCDFRF